MPKLHHPKCMLACPHMCTQVTRKQSGRCLAFQHRKFGAENMLVRDRFFTLVPVSERCTKFVQREEFRGKLVPVLGKAVQEVSAGCASWAWLLGCACPNNNKEASRAAGREAENTEKAVVAVGG